MLKFDRDKFFTGYRAKFGRLDQSQVEGLTALLDEIENDAAITDVRWAAYMLATVKHECADKWKPITEYGPDGYFQKYEKWASLGNTQPGDGMRFRSRGYAQITGRRHYEKFGKLLGMDLLNIPTLALNPGAAYRIMSSGMRMGIFTGHKLFDFIKADECTGLEV